MGRTQVRPAGRSARDRRVMSGSGVCDVVRAGRVLAFVWRCHQRHRGHHPDHDRRERQGEEVPLARLLDPPDRLQRRLALWSRHGRSAGGSREELSRAVGRELAHRRSPRSPVAHQVSVCAADVDELLLLDLLCDSDGHWPGRGMYLFLYGDLFLLWRSSTILQSTC